MRQSITFTLCAPPFSLIANGMPAEPRWYCLSGHLQHNECARIYVYGNNRGGDFRRNSRYASPMLTDIHYRRAANSDFPQILALQAQNLRWNLDEERQQQGFLSVEYGEDDLAAINNGLGIYVALEGERLLAYAMAETREFAGQVPLIAHMASRFPDAAFRDRGVTQLRHFIYGPVCIDRAARGRGLLNGLLQAMSSALSAHFDIGIAFIAQSNIHSYHAHVRKNGMAVIDEFEFDSRRFWTVAFALNESPK